MRIELNNLYILKKRAAKFFGNVIYSFFEKPKYLIRLDDSCETQDQAKWNKIEKLLDNLNIRPIVGVVPDNYDNFFENEFKTINQLLTNLSRNGSVIYFPIIPKHFIYSDKYFTCFYEKNSYDNCIENLNQNLYQK